MEPDLQQQTDLLYHAPEGAVLEVAPGLWLVRGKTKSYEVSETEGTCECPHFQHRLKGKEPCKHLTRLREVLARGPKTCPCCRGEGCAGCDGQGRVEAAMFPVLLAIQQAEDEARLALLKEIFA